MPVSILITQCLQEDFIGLLQAHAPVPNQLHVGHQEALRLQGSDPAFGALAQLVRWARLQPRDRLHLVHIQDGHDPHDPRQGPHLQQFGSHCLHGSPGARLVEVLENGAGLLEKRIRATGLNDCEETDLLQVLGQLMNETPLAEVRIGVVGVWTEAKVSLLLYDLLTRLGVRHLATCSALTASASRSRHFMALDNLRQILGVAVFDSVGEFAQWLLPEAKAPDLVATAGFGPDVVVSGATLGDAEQQVMRFLYRDSARIQLQALSGGFSGAGVYRVTSQDALGHEQAPSVAKLGPRNLIGQERQAFEQVEAILGNEAPSVRGFVDLGPAAGIKYAFAGMGHGSVRTFKSCFRTTDAEELCDVIDTVFSDILGRFYAAAQFEPMPLLRHYGFSTQWASHVQGRAADILGPDAAQAANLVAFYQTYPTGERLAMNEHHYVAYVHGDLNGANILLDSRHNVWIIDFFHTARGHVLKDLAKLENDLLYLLTPLQDEAAYREALLLTKALGEVTDLKAPLPAHIAGVRAPDLIKTWQVVRHLRRHVARLVREDLDPRQLWIAQLRYAAHTLSFDEANAWQKRFALDSACLWASCLLATAAAEPPC